jgi:hypothetical protein
MGQLINSIPKGLLAFLVLFGGILFIVLSDPPKTVCDAQIDLFKKSQNTFLYANEKSKALKKTTQFGRLFENCKATNDPGGCLQLFQLTKKMLDDLASVPRECRSKVAGLNETKNVINYVLELIVRLAWGEKPPQTYGQKMGWIDVADISLYCQLKSLKIEFFGNESWEGHDGMRERIMRTLPGADQMSRNQVWDFSILSENCERYP